MVQLESDVNSFWRTFRNQRIETHISQKIIKAKDRLPWITKEMTQMIKKRARLYRKKRESNNPTYINNFKKIKRQAQAKMRQAYWGQIEDVISLDQKQTNKPNTSKKIWTYIKHRKKENGTIQGLKDKGKLYSDP